MASEPNIKIEQGAPVSHIESGSTVGAERVSELKKEQIPVEVSHEKPVTPSQPIPKSSVVIAKEETVDNYHQKRALEVDNVLSAGLGETFLAMSPDKQKIFKTEGEQVVKKINVLLDATKVNINKIISLIRHWLSIIPGVNRYFLDQEAKIKTDNILKIKNKL